MQIFPAGIIVFTFFVIFLVGEKRIVFNVGCVTFNIRLCLLAYFYSAAAYKVGFSERVWANLAESTEMGSPQLSMSPANVVVWQTAKCRLAGNGFAKKRLILNSPTIT